MKSGKREVAGACLLFAGALVVLLVIIAAFVEGGPAIVTALQGVVIGLVAPTIPSALAVFCVHHLKPQAKKIIPPER